MLGKYRGKIDYTEAELQDILEEYKECGTPCPIDEKGWVYGNLIDGKIPYIVGEILYFSYDGIAVEYWYPVKKETVGQYIGKNDMHANEIYDGDLLDNPDREYDNPLTVIFNNELCCWGIKSIFDTEINPIWDYDLGRLEIVGNIHDKPELSEVEE